MRSNAFKFVLLIFLSLSAPVVMFTGCSENGEVGGNHVYYCPMHPEVQSDKPGVCPICHMDLVLKGGDESDMAEHDDGLLEFNNRKLALANVNTVEAKNENLVKEIVSYSYLDFAEQNRKLITARFSGRIEKLYVDKTGDYINKGDRLFDIYSPEIIQAQNDYLLAVKNLSNISVPGGKNDISESARQRLLLLGITELQITELETSGKVDYNITYYSPFSGTVMEKKVTEGMYVNEGSLIYDIADLSTLWSISEIFSDDIGLIKTGSKVKLTLQSYPGRTFEGKVDLIYPVVSSESRTVKVRSIIDNRDNLLKPNMFGETIFSVNFGRGIVIPSEAVIFTGSKGLVWVQTELGKFRMRDVKTGYNFNGKYHILSGLKEGEKVAAEGSYLIDSESQLRGSGSSDNKSNGSEEKNNNNINSHTDVKADGNGIFNLVCPVLGNKIPEDAVVVEYKGKKIGFCCPGCDQEFNSDPEKYMKNLSPDGKIFNKQS